MSLKKYLRNAKYKISLMLVLVLIIQLITPVMSSNVLAQNLTNAMVEEELVQEEAIEVEPETSEEGQSEEETLEKPSEEASEDEYKPDEEAIDEELPEEELEETKEEEKDEPVAEDKSEPTTVQSETETSAQDETKAGTAGVQNVGPQRELGNIFTFKSLKIGTQDISDGDIIVIEEGTVATIEFSWDTEGLGAQAGDTAEIRLSDAFKTVTTPVQQIIVEGVHVGDYNVENGVLKFVFNENIENDDVHNGFVNLGLEFNLEKFREKIEQEIPFYDGSDQNITVIARPNLEHSGIDKEGHPDTQHDAREITWTIDVINTNDEEITEATLADNIPAGLGEARDFVIHELSVGYNGDIREGADVTSTLNPSGFPIDLGTIAPFNGYRVQYTTTIENYAAESFTNDATFEYGDTRLPADATVGGLTRSNPIEKDGWQVGDTDVIQWQIDVNKNGSLISEAIVEDSLPAGLTVDSDSIEVIRITQSGGNWVEGDAHEGSFTEFPIDLGALGQNDAYRIKFKTNVDWSEVNDGEYQQNNGFKNEATLYDDEDELNDDDATVNIVRDPILEKVEVGNVDYENRTITWEVTVNKAKHILSNVTVTDTLPAGLSIDVDNIEITGDEGTDFSSVTPNIEDAGDGKTLLTINLADVGTETITIRYTTTIDFTVEGINFNSFTNTVGMTGDGIGEGGEDREVTIRPHANTYTKNFVGINYDEKTINWRLNINPIREDINSGFVITDTFPNDGLILLPDTVNIVLGEETLEAGEDYTVAPIDGGYQNGFTITFNREIADGELEVNFTTSYDPQLEVDGSFLILHSKEDEKELYRNKAEFDGTTENGNTIDEEDDASQRVREDSWNSGKKEGQFIHVDDEGNQGDGWVSGSERKIAWQFYFNYQEQNLGKGVVVTDTLAYAGDIDKDSIQVSVYNVDSGGETTITDTVLDSNNYSVNTDENGKFTLTFVDDFEVTKRYVVTFTTSVPDISKENYTNNATVTAGGVEYPYSATLNYKEYDEFLNKRAVNSEGNRVFTGDEVDWQATVNESLSIIKNAVITDTISTGHVYLVGSLEVYRLQDQENALEEGTDYTLEVVPVRDENDEPTGETKLVINITGDLQDTLVLRYTTVVIATDGTISNSISLEGTAIDQQIENSDELNARQFSDAGGEWASNRGALRVTKVDAEEEAVINNNEATFTLWYDLNGEKVQFGDTEYSTTNGVLEIGNLPLRTYYLREIEAPTGYVLSEEEIEIAVNTAYGNSEENIVKVEFENTKEKVDITGTKEWINGDNNRPESIELQLFRDGEPFGDSVTLEGTGDTWTHTWTDLDKTDIDGNEYRYTVDEVNVPDNYEKTISDDDLTITNAYKIPTTDITAEKVWEDGSAEKPTVWFKLFRQIVNEEKEEVPGAERKELSNGTTEVTWEDLDVTDINGNEYIYSVQEVDDEGNDFTPENYVKVENGLTVTNSYNSPTDASATATKVWENGAQERPTIWFQLFRNIEGGELEAVPEAEIKELANGTTQVAWTGLIKTDRSGNEYIFSVKEVDAEGNDFTPENYVKEISDDGLTVTNTYVIPKTDITATKDWVGGEAVRPESIELQLFRDGEPYDDPVTLKDGETEYTWVDLDATDINGNEYVYTVDEVEVPENYVKSLSEDGLTVRNTYVPTTIDVTGKKVWEGGPQPEIQLQLLRTLEGEDVVNVIGTVTLDGTEDEPWNYTWINLPSTDNNGNPYEYIVDELEDFEYSEYYEKSEPVVEKTEDGLIFTITNTFDDYGLMGDSFGTATKVWDGGPEEKSTIWFKLFRQIEGRESEEVPDAEIKELPSGVTRVQWDNLDAFDEEGNEYFYSVQEVDEHGNDFVPENYEKIEDGLTVTNTYVSPKTEVTGTKVWVDGPKERPTIELQLYRDGESYGEAVTLKDGVTKYTWTDLDQTDIDGNEYVYTIDEVKVPENYEKTISEDGLTITNTYDDSGLIGDDFEKLPKTGEGSPIGFYLAGLSLVAAGLIGLFMKKKRYNNEVL